MSATREETELQIKGACSLGNTERAATLALEFYGCEVLGFLIARMGEQRGNDVFSDFLEDFWRGLPGFAWRSTLRSWLYTLARHAISRHVRGAQRRRDRPFDTSAAVAEVAQRVRTETAAYLRTPIKSRFRELRSRLSDDDQTLLILRVDRDLSWRELALVMEAQEVPPTEDQITKTSVRLRQQFQRAKQQLRDLAEAEGLLPSAEDAG